MSTPERDRSLEGRFIYLAEKRVGKALAAINSVAKLSDRKNYTYTEDQATQNDNKTSERKLRTEKKRDVGEQTNV